MIAGTGAFSSLCRGYCTRVNTRTSDRTCLLKWTAEDLSLQISIIADWRKKHHAFLFPYVLPGRLVFCILYRRNAITACRLLSVWTNTETSSATLVKPSCLQYRCEVSSNVTWTPFYIGCCDGLVTCGAVYQMNVEWYALFSWRYRVYFSTALCIVSLYIAVRRLDSSHWGWSFLQKHDQL